MPRLADQKIREAGVTLQLHTMVAAVKNTARDWEVTLCSKRGLHEVRGKVLIDCSGDANAVALAGSAPDA